MDLSFFRGAWTEGRERAPAALDYPMLVAALQAAQAASPAARAQAAARASGQGSEAHDRQPLCDVLSGRPGWRAAIVRQGGSFHPGVAGSHVNLP